MNSRDVGSDSWSITQLIIDRFSSNLDEKKALIKEINHVVLGDFLTSFNSLIFEEDGG